MNMLSKMLQDKKKKSGKELSDTEQEAKISVVKDMKSIATGEMGERLKGRKHHSPSFSGTDEKSSPTEGVASNDSGDARSEGYNPEKASIDRSNSEYSDDCSHLEDDELDAKLASYMHEKMKRQGK